MRKLLDAHGNQLVPALLAIMTLAVFWQVLGHDFLNYDDDDYITANRYVREGLTPASVAWAFTTFHESNWHPITWLSHMLDYRLFGLHAIGHHFVSLLIHLANVLLLYQILRSMTGSIWRSGFVAALFAVHPLHVESVAWVSERKDVISTLFALLAILAYLHYVACPGLLRYALVVGLFALGLMSKPMVVSLPAVLLLLDYWPLDRLNSVGRFQRFRRLLAEKLPLLVLSTASSVVTCLAQKSGQSLGTLERFPLVARIGNALVSYVAYIWKAVYPAKLAVFYPHPGSSLSLSEIIGAFAFLTCVTWLAVLAASRRPYIAVGWLWYIVTLVPAIGLIQVGWQGMADRYTYVPLVGLFIIAAWGIPDLVCGLVSRWKTKPSEGYVLPFSSALSLGVVACMSIIILAAAAWKQTGYWKDNFTLFGHALRVTRDNAVAHNNLGLAYAAEGKARQAIIEYTKAIEIEPGWADAHNNLGILYLRMRQIEPAEVQFRHVLKIAPQHPAGHNNLGATLLQKGDTNEAIKHFRAAIKADPRYARAYINLGTALDMIGRSDEALRSYLDAVRVDPTMADAHYNLGLSLAQKGKIKDAIKHYEEALRLHPDWPEAMNNLAWLLATQKRPSYLEALKAVRLAKKACEMSNYSDPVFLDTLSVAYAAADRWDEAIKTARKALSICRDPKTAEILKTRLGYYQLHTAVPP